MTQDKGMDLLAELAGVKAQRAQRDALMAHVAAGAVVADLMEGAIKPPPEW